MQHTSNFRWKLLHLLSILVHLGLVCAGSVAYVYNLGQNTRPLERTSLTISSADSNPCPLTMVDGIGGWGAFDVAGRTLLMSCIFLVSLTPPACLKSRGLLTRFTGCPWVDYQHCRLWAATLHGDTQSGIDRGPTTLAQANRHGLCLRT